MSVVSVKERVEEVLKLATRGRLVTEVDRNTALTSLSSIRIVCMHVELCMLLNRRAMHVNLLACVSLLDCHDGFFFYFFYSGRGTTDDGARLDRARKDCRYEDFEEGSQTLSLS